MKSPIKLPVIFLTLFLLFSFTPFRSNAFCGFYVAKADASLFNKTSQIILVRDDDKTIITMSSDFEGNVDDFAMVVPVPVVLKRNDIRTVDRVIFQTLDDYSAPRLVEYWDEDPCMVRYDEDRAYDMLSAPITTESAGASMEKDEEYKVHIEAKYTVDEYDILILSAEESGGLEMWLTDNGYKIPKGAEEVLQPYINSGMKFFVVKVNKEELQKKGNDMLSPLQISFNSPKFMLPIRLGMANAKGTQDMLVYAFTHNGRIETTNYRTVKMPTGNNIPEFVMQNFGKFYVDVYRKFRKQNGEGNVYLEYAWDMSGYNSLKCDPCTGTPPLAADLITAGVNWIEPNNYGYEGNVFFTRLHVTYDRTHFPQDLMFEETPNHESYQARYVITHPAVSDFQCAESKNYLKDVYQRRYNELQNLAMLTGWDVSPDAGYVQTLYNYVPEILSNPLIETPGKDDFIDTSGMNTPVINDDSNHVEQGMFNQPFDFGDTSGGKNNNTSTLIIGAMLMLFFVATKKWKKKEVPA